MKFPTAGFTIRLKLILGFLSIVITIAVVGYVAVRISEQALQETIGDGALRLASKTMEEIDEEIFFRVEEMQFFADATKLVDEVQASNDSFGALANARAFIGTTDEDWKAGKNTVVIEEILSNAVSDELREFQRFNNEKHGSQVFAEMYVANKYGVVVGSTGRTSDYLQADEQWYQDAVDEEHFWVGQAEYDESSDSFAIDLVTNMHDDDGNHVEIFKGVLNIEYIRTTIIRMQASSPFESMSPYLVSSNGRVLFSGLVPNQGRLRTDAKFHQFGDDVSDLESVIRAMEGEEGFEVSVVERATGEKELLSAFSPSNGFRDYQGLGWALIVEYETGDILGPVSKVGSILALLSAISVAVTMMIAVLVARSISNPINRLTEMAEEISWGNMEAKIGVAEGRNEIGRLASAFNSMSTKLKESHDALEQRITERDVEIDQRKRTEAKLAEQARHLARSNRELEQFAYLASHDLREPLRMVASYTQLLGRRYAGKLDADADEFIGFAVDGAARMQILIDDLLAYTRVGANGMSREPADCNSVFELAVANLATTIEENGATVTHDDLPTVDGNASQLGQVFQNLIANAIRFRREAPPSVHVSSRLDGPQWVFSIRDNGIGIDPEYTERIFVIFQRLHTREEYEGTGMGLAICKKIVERL